MRLIANWRAARAMLHQARKRDDKALALYEKAWEGKTRDVNAMSAYALLLIRRGEFDRALEAAQYATGIAKKKKPRTKTLARGNMALALWKLGKLDESIAIYEDLLKEGRNGIMLGALGFIYIAKGDETGDYAKALSFNEEALEYDEDDAVIIDNLAQTHMRLGRWEEAEAGFRKALSIRPEQFDSMVCLARCLLHRGEKDEAREWLDKALKRPFSQLNTVERKLAEKLRGGL